MAIPNATLLVVAFRGKKTEIPLQPKTTVRQIKDAVAADAAAQSNGNHLLAGSDVKLLYKGKVLSDEEEDLFQRIVGQNSSSKKLPKKVHLMATGLSKAEKERADLEFEQQKRKAPRILDDLTSAGLRDMEERRRQGRAMMQKAAARAGNNVGGGGQYGFGAIDTLPNLPDEAKAREILETLANDPGILACMAKHKWNVGALKEMYPDGKVGHSKVCVMGLNENKGQRIQLRIRTDDLKGFRKMLSIRKVLFHELAHNVHSEHNQEFFVLMRQIEKECNEMDWTNGAGLGRNNTNDANVSMIAYQGGTYRLGGGGDTDESHSNETRLSRRELTLRAALQRMTPEEEEIEQGCGCGRHKEGPHSNSTSNNSKHNRDDMDLSP